VDISSHKWFNPLHIICFFVAPCKLAGGDMIVFWIFSSYTFIQGKIVSFISGSPPPRSRGLYISPHKSPRPSSPQPVGCGGGGGGDGIMQHAGRYTNPLGAWGRGSLGVMGESVRIEYCFLDQLIATLNNWCLLFYLIYII